MGGWISTTGRAEQRSGGADCYVTAPWFLRSEPAPSDSAPTSAVRIRADAPRHALRGRDLPALLVRWVRLKAVLESFIASVLPSLGFGLEPLARRLSEPCLQPFGFIGQSCLLRFCYCYRKKIVAYGYRLISRNSCLFKAELHSHSISHDSAFPLRSSPILFSLQQPTPA